MNSSLDTANKINIQLTEKKFVEISLEAISAAYKPLDRFSMWLLGATGAFIALIVSNTTLFSALKTSGGWFYFEVIALFVSALCGLIAKFFFTIRIEIYMNSVTFMSEKIIAVLDQHFQNAERIERLSQTINTDVNFYRISKHIASVFPCCLKKKIFKTCVQEFRKARPNYSFCVPLLFWQYSLVLAQSVFLVIAVLVLILCII